MHTVLLRSDGTVVACGGNHVGQCSIPALDGDMTYTQAIRKPRILLQAAFQNSPDTTVMRLCFLSGEEYCRVNILPTDIISKVLARLGRDLGSHCLPDVFLQNGELLTELESATFAPFFSDQESLQGQAETLPEPLVPPTPAQHALMPEEGLAPRSC